MLARRFEEALVYANQIHAAQKRKGAGIPYVSHLLAVAAIAIEQGADEDQAIAALLHDAVEDQGGAERLADIRLRFGERVASMVSDCSDSDIQPKPPWEERKTAYLACLEKKPADSLLVSLADKIHNAEAIVADLHAHGDSVWGRFSASREQTLWYYGELAAAFSRHLPGTAAGRFARAVEQMRILAAR